MSAREVTYGFGVNPKLSENHFYVIIPSNKDEKVQIYERFQWTDGEEQKLAKSDRLRIEISRYKWGKVSADLTAEFNVRLKKDKLKIGRFVIGGTPVEKLFGKELMVLLWGIEDCDPSVIPTAIRNWKGLMPEERWWLYTMTNASTGHIKDKKGWRIALRYALCENPIEEDPQLSLFDMLTEE
ncbi:DUF3780 domain-containing protein [Desulfitobacterium sp.]|uniref:DUF3780 domain-containing protein n=1 Tax=Desulfitobacterium sp. TaxID=49981 RepID=UPI002B20F370|nr:DUF3780 domain-containing protein [Desulfitobacterium sp.]MEA4902367.1 DUF3780 domain-containing protein [Desulfitobacterium sp.]